MKTMKWENMWFIHNEEVFNPISINKFIEANGEHSLLMSFDRMKTNLTDKRFLLLFSVLLVISTYVNCIK